MKLYLHIKFQEHFVLGYSSSKFPSPKSQTIVIPIISNQAIDIMDEIVAARYAPLVLPQNLNRFPNDYLKHLPKFNGEG